MLARSVDEHENATWRAYRADLDDFGSWVRAADGAWSDPSTVADYLRALENAGAKYSTIERRITSIAKLIEVLVATGQPIDTTTRAGRRDVALLLVGWYGAMRRSEIASIRREHVEIDSHGAAIRLARTKASQDHVVVVRKRLAVGRQRTAGRPEGP